MDKKRLRPHGYLLRRGIGASFAFFVPVFAVFYYLTVPVGLGQYIFVAQVVIAILFFYAAVSYARLGVWVSEGGIEERGFFGIRTALKSESIGSIVIMNTFHGGWVETQPQLFVVDPEGHQVLRMRGQFWSRAAMDEVTSTLDVPLTEIEHPVTTSELHARYPGLLYWFERRPILAGLIIGAALVVAAAFSYVALVALGEALGLR